MQCCLQFTLSEICDRHIMSCEKFHQLDTKTVLKLECGPMPNVMVTLLNIGGAHCSTPQRLVDAHYQSTVH